jgi:hypothetical protein
MFARQLHLLIFKVKVLPSLSCLKTRVNKKPDKINKGDICQLRDICSYELHKICKLDFA